MYFFAGNVAQIKISAFTASEYIAGYILIQDFIE